jgi:hypothetical protein
MRGLLRLAVPVLLAAAGGCSFLDDFFSGDSQYRAIDAAIGSSPNERIQAEGAEARYEMRRTHPAPAPQFNF